MSKTRTRTWIGLLVGCTLAASMGTGAQGGAVETARLYIERNRQALGLSASDTGDMVVNNAVRDDHSGVTHVYFQQRYRGIDVFNAILNASVMPNGTVLAVGNRFVSNIAAAARGQQPKKSAIDAAQDAAGHLNLRPTGPFQLVVA